MQAVVLHAARDLRLEPRDSNALQDGEILVRVEFGGICGSDLHYFQHGGFGDIRLREPMILGHEIAGVVVQKAPDAATQNGALQIGDRVAISPSRPCRTCRFCAEGKFNHCLNMRFYGSAMPMPHIQGAFRQQLVVSADQCHVIAPDVPAQMAAFAEPLAVVLHAANRAGSLAGKSVLITGCGPIGALAVMVARSRGAAHITVTDILDPVLKIATKIGADRVINVAETPDWTEEFSADKGTFDAMIEASGNPAAIRAGLEVLRPQSVLVQLGLGGDVALPLAAIVPREIEIRGSFRFHEEFAEAAAMINRQDLALSELLSATFPLDQAVAAFEMAGDRQRAMKVQINFS